MAHTNIFCDTSSSLEFNFCIGNLENLGLVERVAGCLNKEFTLFDAERSKNSLRVSEQELELHFADR